jgi:hypothetical protein
MHKAIRDKYDPKHEWNEGTKIPWEYQKEISDLNAAYRVFMDRRHSVVLEAVLQDRDNGQS